MILLFYFLAAISFVSIMVTVYIVIKGPIYRFSAYLSGRHLYTAKGLWIAAFTSDEFYDQPRKKGLQALTKHGPSYIVSYFSGLFNQIRNGVVMDQHISANITDNHNGTATVEAIFTDDEGTYEYIGCDVSYLHLYLITRIFPSVLLSKCQYRAEATI